MEKIMKKKMIFFILFIFPAGILASSEKEIYEKVREYFVKEFPKSFSAKIWGESLEKSIQNIPSEAIQDAKKVHILLLFHKKWGNRVILKGVSEPFADRFSYIEQVFEFIQPFLQESSYEAFRRQYEITDIQENGFRLKKKLTQGAYLEIGLRNGRIGKVKEYKDGNLVMTLYLSYKKMERYILPERIKVFFYEEKKLRILNFELNDFDFQPNITEEDFLG